MMIPLASMLRGPRKRKRNLRVIAACVLAVVGAFGAVLALYTGEPFNVPLLVFLVGAVLYQWMFGAIAR